jgi:hypothetical protein
MPFGGYDAEEEKERASQKEKGFSGKASLFFEQIG